MRLPNRVKFTLAAITDPDTVREHIETFGTWLGEQNQGWTARPPVSVYSETGQEQLTFVVLKHDQVIGVFTSPMHALIKMGEPELADAFQRHMRDRRSLG